MDEKTNLNNAELNVANENEHFMITQDKIDEILPNGVAAAIVVENVNNNNIENNEPISSMINSYQTATEVLIQPEEAREVSKPECDIDATTAKKCVVPIHGGSNIRSKKQKSNGNFRKRKKENENVKKRLMKKKRREKLDNEEKNTQLREEKGKTQSNEENAVYDSYLSDEEENSNSENENEDSVNINHTGIVEICIIVELDGDDVRVKTMVRSGPTGWKWPTPDDVIWYSRSDLMEIIKQPNFAAVNKRGVFHVPEMQKY
ncbi:hypothetical protein JTB14_002122 [Gonioctena quinquepunctata]|nr:hypothetical protein JTB14_002122 [Gonioctena quinquepunctata]